MFDRSILATPEDVANEGAGVTIIDVGRAIMIWAVMNYGEDLSVAACARDFNTTPDLIREAARATHWIFVYPENETDPEMQLIEVDGE